MATFEIYLILCFVVGSVFSFDACGDVIRDTNGNISSPFFPDLYKSETSCKWEIIAPPHFRIRLSFTHFDVEGSDIDCNHDRVNIFSKMSNKTLLSHGVFCGSELPPVITSEGNSLHIEFRSDRSTQMSGFQAQNKAGSSGFKTKIYDTSYKTIGLDAVLYLRWEDDYLRWNTSEYNGLHELSISANQVWKPDIIVYNASPDMSLFLTALTNVVIHHNGTVTWMPPYSFTANCPPESALMTRDSKYYSTYAFNCTLEVGSQTGDVMKVNVTEYERDVKQGMLREFFNDTHPNWNLESMVAHSERKLRSCCSNAYSLVKFDILLSSMKI